MKVIRAFTIFILALLIVILFAIVGVFVGYYFGLLVDPISLLWLVLGPAIGLVGGMISGMLLSLRFANYFRAKIWPSEIDAAA